MRRVLYLLPLVLLVACKNSLFEGLDEDQANRIVAVLSHHGISSSKERNADKTWNVSVNDDDAVTATELAGSYALPRGGHANLGELFSREGLISSPDEDHIRYVYGLTQELSETLEKIDGVLVARVHIVDPPRDPLNGPSAPPTASVLLRYRSDYNIEPMRDKVRSLVAGAVEGLTPDHVYVTFIAVTPVLTPAEVCVQNNACSPTTDLTRNTSTAALLAFSVMGLVLIASAWVWSSGAQTLPKISRYGITFFRRRAGRDRRSAVTSAEGANASNPIKMTGDSVAPPEGEQR
jgi:type III secretion protein J